MADTDKTGIGDRMKGQYEARAQSWLPRRTFTIIRLDGKAFHTYTRGCSKPYDRNLSSALQNAAGELASEAQGSCFAYVQSDEVSVLLTDFATTTTQAWLDGNVQKIVSISASILTAAFNAQRPGKRALFDARVFTIPDRTEVENYLIWRQQDCKRNSIAGLAQAHFSHRQLHQVNTDGMQELLWREKEINWADEDPTFKNGALVVREVYDKEGVERSRWTSSPAPIFTQEREVFEELIPSYG
jgi:tRNA(His) 5'-end guanylyltransferase